MIIHIKIDDGIEEKLKKEAEERKKPYCNNCPFEIDSEKFKKCCENRIYWTEKFDSLPPSWNGKDGKKLVWKREGEENKPSNEIV